MNKISKYIVIALCTIGFASCNKWLSDTSGDLLIPRSVTEFVPLLYGEGYPRSFNDDGAWIALMTDDIGMGFLEHTHDAEYVSFDAASGGEGRRAFRWDADIEEGITDMFWVRRYQNILGCNTIIVRLPHMLYTEAQVGLYHSLAARAYTLRAYNYFCLVNLYAMPWSPQNLNMPGVVIRTSPEITGEPIARSSIEEVYKLIEADLTLAEYHMARAEVSANRHFIGPQALMLLQTRVALFQEKWDDVIQVGERFLANNPAIRNLNAMGPENELGLGDAAFPFMFDLNNNPEIVFTFGNTNTSYNHLSTPTFNAGFGFRVSRPVPPGHPNYPSPNVPLMSLYEQDEYFDLRRLVYFRRNMPITGNVTTFHYHYPMKYKSSSAGYRENWRTVEVYLNVAEAHARRSSGVSEEAIELLNTLRINRIRTTTFKPKTAADFANKEALVQFIWDERRRELCFEEHHRWWDLRRQGMRQLEHREFVSNIEFDVYILPQGSPNWVLEIPRSEVLFNDRIVGNNRVYINPS